ncbi:legumain-like [Chanos chanos]|uniref:legumain n=1 Tax=Chanos chanos TaxID=29144 RepID=A0A6J2VFY2_CHACN|nr:legumain-like [Chanos chanos]
MSEGNSKSGKQWVLLAAGSKGWDNYRHQANVCHAYQIVHKTGIPDEQIVVMMYDDIVDNIQNPHKGEIINIPDGPNVYKGVLKDYTGKDVSSENFLAILSGNKQNGLRKVIKSGKKDTIFVYLSDHGNVGIFAFPHSTLYAADLIDTVTEMAKNNQFAKMVIYISSCCSGSMLSGLPGNVEVYGVSSCQPHESSCACFLDSTRHTYLNDEFSYNWMLHTEKNILKKTTFHDQFIYLKQKVESSTSCEYGEKEVSLQPIGTFLLNPTSSVREADLASFREIKVTHVTPTHDVPLKILESKIQAETDSRKKNSLKRQHEELQANQNKITEAVAEIHKLLKESGLVAGGCQLQQPHVSSPSFSLTRVRELKDVAEHFRMTCFNWHDEEFEFALSQMDIFAQLCEWGVTTQSIKDAITIVSSRFKP